MDDPRDAEDATRELDGSRMCGRRVKVSFCLLLFFPLLVPSTRNHNPLFRLLNKSGQTTRLGNFSADSSSFQLVKNCPKILVSRPTGITTLPFPTFSPYSNQASLPQPSSERKKAYQKAFPRPLCLAYQAKLLNKQVRLCRSLPKIRVFFKPLNLALILNAFCPSGPDE